MKIKELIEALQKFPPDMEVAIFDYRKNLAFDNGDLAGAGIYPHFHVEKIELEEEPAPGTEPFIPWVALGFSNEEFEDDLQRCRVCGCTNEDCSQCIAKNGHPCHWVEPDLCSACAPGSRILKPGVDF